jgi:hypothetical protein
MKRFWDKVDIRGEDECWEWTGAKSVNGTRPYIRFLGQTVVAYRLAYELVKGEIPEGLYVCHSCDNGLCCNPAHLWAGTQKQNLLDASAKGRLSVTGPTCETHGMRKLSASDVKDIYLSKNSASQIAAEYNVTPANIYHIRAGKTWRKVTDPLRRGQP